MKRDNDLLRELMFRLESEQDHISTSFLETLGMTAVERAELGHVRLLADAGLVEFRGPTGNVVRVTNTGHDFIAAIREDTTWNKTKEITAKAGISTLSVLFDVAVGLGKEKLVEMTGMKI